MPLPPQQKDEKEVEWKYYGLKTFLQIYQKYLSVFVREVCIQTGTHKKECSFFFSFF